MWNKEKTIVVIVAAAVIVVAVIFSLTFFAKNTPSSGTNGSAAPGTTAGSAPVTKAPVPANVVVPNEGDVAPPANVAVPEVQASAHPTGDSSYRQFALNEDSTGFTPNTVAVKKGDIVDLEITAATRGYDFTQPDYGFNVSIAPGVAQKVQFQAVSVGKFTFYCSSCGGPTSGPVGYLIVTAN